ncbi:MAG TPA: hypothetical protein ENK57_16375 [Polyangiaceae bacterium]|nr:hypothetical protein [Polyangiaceae bacterium]
MRANVVFALLIVLLGGLVGGLVARGRIPHVGTALVEPLPTIESDTSVDATAAATTQTTASPATSEAAGDAPPAVAPPPLDRPLSVVTSAWEVAAPAVMANGGVFGSDDSPFARARLDVSLSAASDLTLIENALARGGSDPAGADVIVLPLPRFAAAFERLEVLGPQIFFVVGFARGGDVLAGPTALEQIAEEESVVLTATPGSSAAMLGLFAFDAAGVSVTLQDHSPEPSSSWRAVERKPSQAGTSTLRGRVALSTAQASRLVPHVAVARRSFLRAHPDAAAALVEGWLEGRRMVDDNREATARAIADTPGGPAMLTVLNDLHLVDAVDLILNAQLMGLAGRRAVTLPHLFVEARRWWHLAGVTTSADVAATPVDGSVVALVARRQRALDDDEPPAPDDESQAAGAGTADPDVAPPTLGELLLTQRLPGSDVDENALSFAVARLAEIFPHAAIEVSLHPGGVVDEDAAEAILARTASRFDVDRARLVTGTKPGRTSTIATLRVRELRD